MPWFFGKRFTISLCLELSILISADLLQSLSGELPQLARLMVLLKPVWLVSALPFLLWIGDRSRRVNDSNSMQYSNDGDAKTQLSQLQNEVERLRSLLLMTANLNSTLNYERVLEMTLDLAHNALEDSRDSRLVSALMLFSKDDLFIASARGFG